MERPQYDLPEPSLMIVLDPPIKHDGGGEVTEVNLREPTAAQVRSAETHLQNGMTARALRDYQLALVTSVSGLSRKVIDQLPISQLVEGAEYLQDFISPHQRTGPT